jgi:hypothetical protein
MRLSESGNETLEALKEVKIHDPLIEWGLRFLNFLQQNICKYLQHLLAKILYQGRQPFEVNEGTASSGWPQQYIQNPISI